MKLQNKVILGLLALGLVGASVTTAAQGCIDDNGVTFKAAEELIINESRGGEIVESSRLCFKTKAEYEVLKNDRINDYKLKDGEEKIKWLLSDEGQQLDDILTHEIKKRGTIQLPSFKEGDDIFLAIIDNL